MTERIKTRTRTDKSIYRDRSTKIRYTTVDGREVWRRHDCWRADYRHAGIDDAVRIRRRFKSYEEARAWLNGF